MKKSVLIVGLLVCVAVWLGGCGKSSDEEDMERAAKQMEEAAEKMAEAGKKMGEKMGQGVEDMTEALKMMGKALSGGEEVEPVDFRKLKKLLPEKLAGMKRVRSGGERNAVFGIKVSQAEAEYESRDGGSVQVEIIDLGSIKGVARYAKFGWTMAEIDRETDHGYERTFTYRGQKGFEEYDTESRDGKIQLIVANRFAVEIDGSDVDMKKLKKVLKDLDISKLERMKDEGVKG